MRINSVNRDSDRCFLSITFCNESEERNFLKKIIDGFDDTLAVNCIITDLDTIYSMYKTYFPRCNYCVFDHLTYASIYAYELNHGEIEDVISNWGYYTIDAMFLLGESDLKVKKQKDDCLQELKSMPIVITQVLDFSLNIDLEPCYFEKILKFLVAI